MVRHAVILASLGLVLLGCFGAPSPSTRVLDAQHIANGGERATKVEDVMVVCRNCHAGIHAAA